MDNLIEEILLLDIIDEVLVRKVSKLGNSGHISIPSKHIGKEAKVIILKVVKE
jgi:putative transposon-encoded protein|tara:strand:- start:267 stop:425 length:159 start_codon:yes stop_codon:yes gene_type:complete